MAQDEREVTLKGIDLNVKLNPAGAERLDLMRSRFKTIPSFAAVTRECYRIGDILTDLLSNGETLLVQDKDGKIEKLNLGLDIALKN